VLSHRSTISEKPPRAVVLGAAGFVGSATVRHLQAAGIETLPLRRQEVDLLAPSAQQSLATYLLPEDVLIFVSARAPCKDAAMLTANVKMAEAVSGAIANANISHLIYVSSDAVYKDSAEALTETSCAEPNSVHGAMHLAREIILRTAYRGPFGVIRPTLIYGPDDPHNGYGPNRFRRLAARGADIALFGNGEERRDHVNIEDVAALTCLMVKQQSFGILNAVSGATVSFRELAEFVAKQFSPQVSVLATPRSGPMPHNGFRPFDPEAISTAFPTFRITDWRSGIGAMCAVPVVSRT
jgi:UDP-glucose 4-epimerase